MNPILITFSGIDGAGKTTQIDKLREYLKTQNLSVRVLTFWDDVALFSRARSGFSRRVLQSDGKVGTPQEPANRNDKNNQLWPLLMGRSFLYLLDVFRLRKIVRETRAESTRTVIIFDRYMYDQLAALPLRSWLPRTYARLMLMLTPKPDISYVLDAVPDEARARKPEYPIEFLREYRNSYLELRKLAQVCVIPAADPDAVHAAVVARLTKAVGEPPLAQVDSAVVA